jgi:hypothetical protein
MTQKSNYLHELLAALAESERKSLLSLPLKGKEKELLELYISYIGKNPPSKEKITERLGMSGSHIDKTSSILLKKCYDALVIEIAMPLWDIFRHKHLPRHFYHELSIRERELKRSGDSKMLAKFYYDAFENIHQLPYQDYDPEEAERFMKSYFTLTPDITNGDRLMIEGRFVRQQITNGLTTSNGVSSLIPIRAKLDELEKLINDSVASLPIVQYDLAAAQFYKVVMPDTDVQRRHFTRSIELVDNDPSTFAVEDPVLLRLKVADTYFQDSDFTKAYGIYSEIIPFKKELIRTQFFHLTTYAHLATLCKKFEVTDNIIKEFFSTYYGTQNWQVQTMADITLAKRYLYSGEVSNAKKHIDRGFLTNEKGIIISFDVELRKLETLYFALSGDLAFAEDLISKHIKFLHSKKISVKESLHGKFFKILREIITERTTGKKLSKQTEELLAEQSSSFQAIYGFLLSKVRQKP